MFGFHLYMSDIKLNSIFSLFNVHDGMSQILAEGSAVKAQQTTVKQKNKKKLKHYGPEFQCHLPATKFSLDSSKLTL